ncbi:DUF4199 domain-containing protein [Catalinimonas niigatensis]|uniref:DUF4199 domain-containing protein n=1 Tax=Catalinimonas niigatensis TaxID=1397264 RepID=UPI002664F20F|nr:DUF4199 domain-containing protein [Catalinimonas niigatensis]WPP52243.1 DUF4199 domain-containing protein [Catalinimonas niigatensis]
MVPFKYGVVGGVLSIILFFVVYLLGENPLVPNHLDFFVNSIILLVFIIFSIREFRISYNSNILHFLQGITIGILTVIIIGLITSISMYVYLTYFNYDLLNSYKEIMDEQLRTNKETYIEQFDENIFNMLIVENQRISPIKLAQNEFLKKKLLVGFFVTIIVSVIMRRSPVVINK